MKKTLNYHTTETSGDITIIRCRKTKKILRTINNKEILKGSVKQKLSTRHYSKVK